MKQKETVAQIKTKLQTEQFTDVWLKQLQQDERVSVKKLLAQYEKNKQHLAMLQLQFNKMCEIENELRTKQYQFIAGIDEVGRGPLAGPVVAAAVILPANFTLIGLNDSKQLSEKKRDEFYEYIKQESIAIGIGVSDHDEIDSINIYEATKLAMKRAVMDLNQVPDYLLIDAMKLSAVPIEQQSIIKGDAKSISIASASIVAKVTRDRWMKQLHEQYPMYHFQSNMGYGTKEHLDALEKYGPSPYHRKSFQPVQNYVT
ncbi:ribonuclease HII [Bacillaceae bacterium W0354]